MLLGKSLLSGNIYQDEKQESYLSSGVWSIFEPHLASRLIAMSLFKVPGVIISILKAKVDDQQSKQTHCLH